VSDLLATPAAIEVVSPRRRLRTGLRQPLALIGLAIVLAWMLLALFASWVAPHDPLAQDFVLFEPPSRAHPFGTDELGRDVLSRVVYGARLSLPLAVLLVSLSILVGGVLGSIAGYFRSLPDAIVMRTVDLVFAFPAIILAMVVTASLGPNVRNAVLAIVVVSWPTYARVVRGLVLSLGDSQFVQSSRLLGSSSRRTLVRDILPNLAGPVIVLGTLDLANAILLLSGLSFLGLGAQPPTPEWGSMVAVGTQNFQFWWVGMFPGLAIFTAVLAFNFLGDSLRDRFDPRGHARESNRGRA
jgi:peptide/nickel transport system permease protein